MRLPLLLASCLFIPLIPFTPQTAKAETAVKQAAFVDGLAKTLTDRWILSDVGIAWQVKDQHEDHLEFSGEKVSAIIYYGNDEKGNLSLKRKIVWPMLRTIPNDTHASLTHDFPLSVSPVITVNGKANSQERVIDIQFDGVLTIESQIDETVSLSRTLAPSPTAPIVVERFTITNMGSEPIRLNISALDYRVDTQECAGVYGVYSITASNDITGEFTLSAGKSLTSFVEFKATKQDQKASYNPTVELAARQSYISSLKTVLQLDTPDPVLNKMFDFAKLRSAESIFRTKGGLMHAPGGGRYYAAIWANDQAEYINPFFPFLGNKTGNESAINSFRHFARFMNDDFNPIPSSIIAEGDDIWNGAGDRGDCAMIAYGASRFALAYGEREQAKRLLPLIDWCLDFSFNKMSNHGVIASDSDELEGRFPAGEFNLSTNMLTYGALISSSHLNRELGREAVALRYQQQAKELHRSIERYFGAKVQGYDTYRYYEGNDKLRAWIALPLTMGIFERKQGTLDALLSPLLWSSDGIYSEAGNETFWDRATLYAFRGIFSAAETDTAMRYFKYYSRKRLLGEHVPYAVEAWPEGSQRHLSAESALYARVVIEGVFGIEPTGFKRFNLAPYLPTGWNEMCLNHIRAFGDDFSVCVERKETEFEVIITPAEGKVQTIYWAGDKPLSASL